MTTRSQVFNELKRMHDDSELFYMLEEMAGTWHDGSSTCIVMTDDINPHEYVVKVGEKRFSGSSFSECIQNAYKAFSKRR